MYAFLIFLLPMLLQLHYDDSRRVGDVAVRLSHDWKSTVCHQYIPQKIKLDKMMRRRGTPPTPDDEFTAQADLVESFRATIYVLDGVDDYFYSLGYRPPPPVFQSPNFPADRPSRPEGR
jgi:hypothetical protein